MVRVGAHIERLLAQPFRVLPMEGQQYWSTMGNGSHREFSQGTTVHNLLLREINAVPFETERQRWDPACRRRRRCHPYSGY